MRGVKTAGVHTDEVVFKHCSNSSRSEDAAPRPRPRHSHTTAADDQAHRQAASVFHHYNRKEGKKDGFFIYVALDDYYLVTALEQEVCVGSR